MPGLDAESADRTESSVAPSRSASSEPERCGLGFELPVQAEATKAAPTLPTPRRNCLREIVAPMGPFRVPADARLCGEQPLSLRRGCPDPGPPGGVQGVADPAGPHRAPKEGSPVR